MRRTFLALLHIDGRGFAGWQRQARERTVQGVLEGVLSRLCNAEVPVTGAGRTDAGVHAVGMGASFTVPARWETAAMQRALNALLPADLWVERVHAMQDGFSARRSAESRRYRYEIGTDPACRSPFRRPYEWALGRTLDVALLDAGAERIRGTHAFQAFAAAQQPKPHYRCTIREARWDRRADGTGVRLHIEADRFLHHMVRFLVGTMVDIALGRRPLEDMDRLLGRTDNAETSPPSPPEGLYFVAASYPASCYLDQPPALAGVA